MKANFTLLMMFGCMACSAAVNTQPKFTLNSTNFTLQNKENAKVQTIVPKDVNRMPAATNAAMANVTCNLNYEMFTANPNWIMVVNKDFSQMSFFGFFDTSKQITVPEGNYDVIVTLYDDSYSKLFYIVREQADLTDGMTLDFDLDEVTEHIQFRYFNPDGEAWSLPTVEWVVGDDGYYQLAIVEEGNVEAVGIQSSLVIEGIGYIGGMTVSSDSDLSGGITSDESADFYINPVSDRYKFLQSRLIFPKGNNIYVNKLAAEGVGTSLITNDPANYKVYNEELVHRNRPNAIGERYAGYRTFDNYGGGWTGETGVVPVEDSEFGKFYLDIPSSLYDGGIDYNVTFAPSITEIEEIDGKQYSYPTLGTTITYMGDEIEYVYVATDAYHFQQTEPTEGFPQVSTYPGLKRFGFTAEQKKGIQGDNVPIMMMNMTDYPSMEGTYFTWDFSYYGNYGESVGTMVCDATYKLIYDGEEVECPAYYDFKNYPYFKYEADPYFDGIVDATITSEYGVIDGLKATNVARIVVDPKNYDKAVPTMRMLQIRDNQNNVTNLVGDRAGSKISLLAVDYQMDFREDGTFYYANHPVTLEFSYAPAGTDAWTPMQVNEMTEENSCTYGQVYEVALDDVEGGAGWYAVRVKVTDSEGNYQEQIITPAFKLDEEVSIANVNVGSVSDAYDLMGRKLSTCQRGLSIVRDGKNTHIEVR